MQKRDSKNNEWSKSIYRKLSAVSINGITEDNVENELHYTCSYSKDNYNNYGSKYSRFLAQSEQTRSSVVEATIKTWRGPEMDLVWSQQDKKNMSAC